MRLPGGHRDHNCSFEPERGGRQNYGGDQPRPCLCSSGSQDPFGGRGPQGSVGLSLTRQSRTLTGFYDLIGDPALRAPDLIVPTRLETLSLVAAGQASAYELGGGSMGVSLHRVRMFLKEVAAERFTVCIVDTAAGLFGATADVLSAATAVMVPQQAEPLGIRSVPKMLEALARMRVVNPKLHILGVVLTMMQPELAESRDTVQALRNILPPELVMRTVIPRDDLFIRASAKGLPVGVLKEGAPILTVFDNLRAEVESILGGRWPRRVIENHGPHRTLDRS